VKTPFYMTYPIQNLYQAEIEYEKDMERMKELYPTEVRKILVCVEERCDELEFEGSRIYDENPDRAMMWREIQRLYQKLLEEGMTDEPTSKPAAENPMLISKPVPVSKQMPDETVLKPVPGTGRVERLAQKPVPSDRSFALHLPDGWELPEDEVPKETQPEELLIAMQLPPEGGPGPRPCGEPGSPCAPGGSMPPPPPQQPPCNSWLCNTVGILFGNEVYRRRCRYRRCHRWW
jgi:hypothetical protein